MRRNRNFSRVCAGVALIALLSPWNAASAADIGGRGKPAGPVPVTVPGRGSSSEGTGPAGPLKGVIRLSPGAARTFGTPRFSTPGFEQIKKKYGEFSGDAESYESGSQMMLQIAKACAGKTYTVQDQQAAGCIGNETLDQCKDKLYKHCVKTFTIAGGYLPGGGYNPVTGKQKESPQVPGFSTKQFQDRANATAVKARALSQMLTQYANEVEQKAKALVP